ncbi:MAG: N-acetyl-alpha-D-glucosaminyl L-malate synthase BshA [Paenibacillaceae bacterium ZCTH02-B3]|nr:MAG: N-acetyl-alpha-D-glucosaminyl L-malate synthase BshA [Paenibacillaceae bacterium ZCTH02-B3]
MARPLRIGITCYPTIGGSGVVATELGKLMAERGHEIHFITHGLPFRAGTFRRNMYYHEVEVTDYHVFRYPPYELFLASKMYQAARMQKLDLLHVHYAVPHALSAFLAKEMAGDRLKVVTTLHGTDITILGQDASLKEIIRLGIRKSDAVTAVSRSLIRETRELLDIREPIDLVYNFVDERVYYPRENSQLRKEFAAPEEKLLIHISNFRPVKRTCDLADIFARVNRRVHARLLLVGEGPELPNLQAKFDGMGLADRVIFFGKQEDVAEIVSAADLMLLPSEKESFGLAALEAMACGVPTVGSLTGGLPEVVEHGVTGFLAPVGDTETMAEYALRLLTDDVLRAEFGRACVRRAREHFDSRRIADQYERIYYRVLGIGESAALSVCE